MGGLGGKEEGGNKRRRLHRGRGTSRVVFARSDTCRFLFLVSTRTIDRKLDGRARPFFLSPTPFLTYLGGENKRTCRDGRIWNISDGAGPNPEGLSRHFRVDIDTRVGKNRACLSWALSVTFSSQDRVRCRRLPRRRHPDLLSSSPEQPVPSPPPPRVSPRARQARAPAACRWPAAPPSTTPRPKSPPSRHRAALRSAPKTLAASRSSLVSAASCRPAPS